MKDLRALLSGFATTARRSPHALRYALLAAIIAFFAVLKGGYDPGLGRPSTDGDYYYQIARNVAEGHGFRTNVSLYNQGLTYFPHEINHSPMWPLTMGLLGKLFDLEEVAHIVPEILYGIALVLLYLLTVRVARRIGEEEPPAWLSGKPLDVGHIVVCLFATNVVFFKATSTPYTEGMAFCFLFAALIAADAAAERLCLRRAALAGALAALAFLTRTQMIGVALAIVLVFALHGIRERRFFVLAGASAAAMAVVVLPWVAWVASWADIKGLQAFSGMGSIQEIPTLRYFRQTVSAPSADDRLRTLVESFKVAFSPKDKYGYPASFLAVVYAVPLALLAVISSWPEAKRFGKRLWTADGCLPAIALLAALAMLAPLHLDKRQFFYTWLFGWRHGLPFILLIALALAYLFTRAERLGRTLATVLVVITLIQSVGSMRTVLNRRYVPGPTGPEAELARWLDAQEPRPKVITTNAQVLSAFSRSYFHWMDCKVSAKHTRVLLESGAADYVLLYPKDTRCAFFKPLKNELEVVKTFKDGYKVELLRPKIPRLGASQR